MVEGLDPRHVRVVPIAAPTPQELRHHFLWRFSDALPGLGEMTVFDRSWYGRALVERVEGLIDEEEAHASLGEIVEFERRLVARRRDAREVLAPRLGEEQLKRFRGPPRPTRSSSGSSRPTTGATATSARPTSTPRWRTCSTATDRPHAHWDLISGENKHYARAAVLETLIDRWSHDLERRGLTCPSPAAATTWADGACRHLEHCSWLRYGITIPFDGVTLRRAPRVVHAPRRPRLHRRLVGRGRRGRRLHPAGPGRRVGAATGPRASRSRRSSRAGPGCSP